MSATKTLKLENVCISTTRNVWGYWTVSGFVNNYLMSVKCDRKPTTKAYAKQLLIDRYDYMTHGK